MPVSYSLFDAGHLLTIQTREQAVLNALRRFGFGELGDKRILEIGCGHGNWLRDFVRWGAHPGNLFGIEIDPERAALARELCAPGVTVECKDAQSTGCPDASFDLVLQSTLFSSLPEPRVREAVAREMLRVRKPEGIVLWYDLRVNNPANLHVRGIGERELSRLFPSQRLWMHRITLAPPIARRVATRAWNSAVLLSALRPLTTHYLAVISQRGVEHPSILKA